VIRSPRGFIQLSLMRSQLFIQSLCVH